VKPRTGHREPTHPGPLIFVQSNTATAGLGEGLADAAVVRRPVSDPRFDTALVGEEARYAAMATDNRLARRRTVALGDLSRYPIAIDVRTGTTTRELWPANAQPVAVRTTGGLDEWLTLIAAGQAVGITSEATANQNPRPGVAYRTVRDAPPISVWLVWWKDDRPPHLDELIDLTRRAYQRH